MQLSQRMVRLFCGALDMSDNLDFSNERVNNCGVRLSIRNSSVPGVPEGAIVTAATSFWLPLSPHIIFDFLKDPTKRAQVHKPKLLSLHLISIYLFIFSVSVSFI